MAGGIKNLIPGAFVLDGKIVSISSLHLDPETPRRSYDLLTKSKKESEQILQAIRELKAGIAQG